MFFCRCSETTTWRTWRCVPRTGCGCAVGSPSSLSCRVSSLGVTSMSAPGPSLCSLRFVSLSSVFSSASLGAYSLFHFNTKVSNVIFFQWPIKPKNWLLSPYGNSNVCIAGGEKLWRFVLISVVEGPVPDYLQNIRQHEASWAADWGWCPLLQ